MWQTLAPSMQPVTKRTPIMLETIESGSKIMFLVYNNIILSRKLTFVRIVNVCGLEILYFGVILCVRQRFITVSAYTIRGTDTTYVFTFTTCFDLMWPSSGTLGLTITYFFSCYSPYTGQCLPIGSALYVLFYVMPYVTKRIKYWIFKILKF
jgi:hypothetical protein